MSGIRKRLKALEGVRQGAPEGEGERDGLDGLIAEAERQACLLTAHYQHHRLGVPVDGVLSDMLRYVDEAEARRLLAMDYTTFYSAAGMPHHEAAKPVQEAKHEERARPKIRIPGRAAR